MSATYPPVGTRVRWTSQAQGYRKAKEGVVRVLRNGEATQYACAFRIVEVFGWGRAALDEVLVVEVDTVDGKPRRSGPRYYRPRPEWLETAEGSAVSRFNALIRLPVPAAAWDEEVLREDFGSNRLMYLRWLIGETGWFDIFDEWTAAELIALERDDREPAEPPGGEA